MATTRNVVTDQQLGWLSESLLVINSTKISYLKRDIYGEAAIKFNTTEPGGMIYMNPLPQGCRFADLRIPNRLSRMGTGAEAVSDDVMYDPDIRGLGEIYSGVFDDNSQVVHFRWGVYAFNSIASFWTTFYQRDASAIARTGSVDSGFLDTIGGAIGFVFSIPFYPFYVTGKVFKFFSGTPGNRYWYVQPAMHIYWSALNTMVNIAAVNLGIITRTFSQDQSTLVDSALDSNPIDRTAEDQFKSILHEYMPDIFRSSGAIDVVKLASYATKIAHVENEKIRAIANEADDESRARLISEYAERAVDRPNENGTAELLDRYVNSNWNKANHSTDVLGTVEVPRSTWSKAVDAVVEYVGDLKGDLSATLDAELADGSAFVSYRVNHTGALTESFSNSTSRVEIFDTVNAKVKEARTKIYNFAGGNLGDGIGASAIESVVSSFGDLVGSALDGIGLSGLAVAAGAALTSSQELWEESIANIPDQNYTVELHAISGDALSVLLDIYIPAFGLIAAAMPRSTGPSSYTGPFVGEMFDRGRCVSRNVIITDISIERGGGDVGWTAEGLPLSFKLNFTCKDLNTVIHMPVSGFWSLDPAKMLFAEDTPFNDYMSAITNLSLREIVYPLSGKLSLNYAKYKVEFRNFFSMTRVIQGAVNGTRIGRLVQGLIREQDRTL